MIIITDYLKNITKYIENKKNIFYPFRNHCKNCGYTGLIHRHGYYQRWIISFNSVTQIYILRLWCPSCKKTYSVIPSFLIPYFQFSFDVIFKCLYLTFVLKYTYSKTIKTILNLNPELPLNRYNIYCFRKNMKHCSPLTNTFFTQFKDLYQNMDDSSPESVLDKINKFINAKTDNFNSSYYETMPEYFFKEIS